MLRHAFVRTNSAQFIKITALAIFTSLFSNGAAQAQFLHPVVLMQGTVRAQTTAQPTSLDVSIRDAKDTSLEVTKSHSNSVTGQYTVVLMPGKSYLVHLVSDTTRAHDEVVTTPAVDHYQKIEHDFTVASRDDEGRSNDVGAR